MPIASFSSDNWWGNDSISKINNFVHQSDMAQNLTTTKCVQCLFDFGHFPKRQQSNLCKPLIRLNMLQCCYNIIPLIIYSLVCAHHMYDSGSWACICHTSSYQFWSNRTSTTIQSNDLSKTTGKPLQFRLIFVDMKRSVFVNFSNESWSKYRDTFNTNVCIWQFE